MNYAQQRLAALDADLWTVHADSAAAESLRQEQHEVIAERLRQIDADLDRVRGFRETERLRDERARLLARVQQ